jgi:hypothetical protein
VAEKVAQMESRTEADAVGQNEVVDQIIHWLHSKWQEMTSHAV